MRHSGPTPLSALARGAIAGVIGTGFMTAWQTLAAKLQSSDEPQPKPGQAQDPWEQASAPAKVAKRVGEGVFRRDLSPDLIPLLTNVMHWGYGTGWATIYGISTAGRQTSTARRGAAFGTAVWASSYLQLVPMGLYIDRPSTSDPPTAAYRHPSPRRHPCVTTRR